VAPENLDDLAHVRDALSIPLAAEERVNTLLAWSWVALL
jgi:L-alanine-DL-glutamate epimerase-like enolase superfamily enzyme